MHELWLAGTSAVQQFATYVPPDHDLVLYGLDLVIATDLLNTGRNISIFCRTLTITPPTDGAQELRIDLSATPTPGRETAIQPDIMLDSQDPTSKAENGGDIIAALGTSPSSYKQWFSKDPGKGWGARGARGGNLTIACESLVFQCKLSIKANGAKGNAGIGGQSRNYIQGAVGGDAGQGGQGGDGGTVSITYRYALDAKRNPISLGDWVTSESTGGPPGDPGAPGDARDSVRKIDHPGSAAQPQARGNDGDVSKVVPDDFSYTQPNPGGKLQSAQVPDLTMVSASCPLQFWNLLYHRAKLGYLQGQSLNFSSPDQATWQQLGEVVLWAYRFAFAYGYPDPALQGSAIGNITADPEIATKKTLSNAINVMRNWYLAEKTMWGYSNTRIPPLPFDTIAEILDQNFPQQTDVRDMYLKVRSEFEATLADNEKLTKLRQAAQNAVAMHQSLYQAMKAQLFGSIHGQVDPSSLLGQLAQLMGECDTACETLQAKIKALVGDATKLWNFSLPELCDCLQSMMFVAGEPPAFIGMAGLEAGKLAFDGLTKITNDAGISMDKSGVIQKLNAFSGALSDLAALSHDIGSSVDRRRDEVILTSLDTIEQFVSQFTHALGADAQQATADIDDYRARIKQKNDLWSEYNDRAYQMAKEYEDWQAAVATLEELNESSSDLSKNVVDTTLYYADVYLMNIEKTADLMAQLSRKYAYTTLGALPSFDYVGDARAFWDADAAGASATIQITDGRWKVDSNPVCGTDSNSNSITLQLAEYEGGTSSLLLFEPPLDDLNDRSMYYITLDGANPKDASILSQLLANRWIFLQVWSPWLDALSPDTFPRDAPKPDCTRAHCYPLNNYGDIYDARVIKINPWLEGVETQSGEVRFTVALGASSLIFDGNKKCTSFTYDTHVITDFSHLTRARIADKTNHDETGASHGDVVNNYIDSRGTYASVGLWLPDSGDPNTNAGLRAANGIGNVKLRVCFNLSLRNYSHAPAERYSESFRRAAPGAEQGLPTYH